MCGVICWVLLCCVVCCYSLLLFVVIRRVNMYVHVDPGASESIVSIHVNESV